MDIHGKPTATSPLNGKVVLVTGGGSGIGAAVAKRLYQEGAQVVIVGRRRAPLESVASQCNAYVLSADMADSQQAEDVVAQIINRFGQLDVLVANAGGHGFARVTETNDIDWQRSLRTNLNSAFVTARAVLPSLMARQGAIVIVSSLAGLFAGPAVAGYTVTKHALIGLTKSLARDYGRYGVRVNALCPGWVRTPMADAEMEAFAKLHNLGGDIERAYQQVTKNVPLRRVAEPEEMASIVNFLVSSQASYITGATLVADGGAHIVDLPTLDFVVDPE